jgi:hypothetical protein
MKPSSGINSCSRNSRLTFLLYSKKKKARKKPGLFLFRSTLLPAAGDHPHLKRPGVGPQPELDTVSMLLDPPQENVDTTRWGLVAPHLGHTIFKSLSDAPWIISN